MLLIGEGFTYTALGDLKVALGLGIRVGVGLGLVLGLGLGS